MRFMKSHPGRDFSRAAGGVAAVEFAIILPLLLLLLLGGFELSRYLHQSFRVSQAASNIGLMLSQFDTTLKPVDIEMVRNAASLIVPQVRRGRGPDYANWRDRIRIDLASVDIRPVAGSKTFEAKPVWITANSRRSCSVLKPLNAASDNYEPDGLPSALLTGAGSVVVVDVSYPFVPVVGNAFFSLNSRRIERSVYIEPRQGNLIRYDNTNTGVAANCT
jgi:Flp pilus assembly protein TadG